MYCKARDEHIEESECAMDEYFDDEDFDTDDCERCIDFDDDDDDDIVDDLAAIVVAKSMLRRK